MKLLKSTFFFFALVLTPFLLFAQKTDTKQLQIVTGVVSDGNNESLAGVSVVVDGSTRGVSTDLDGTFSINVNPADRLIFSYLGFENQTITVGTQTHIVVYMKEKGNILDEVTVVAFGQQKKQSVVGAISTVNLADLRAPVGKISNSLAGQLAGVVSVQRSGEPGSGSDFWIRGITTFGANNKPLVLVDGIDRSLDLVETEDIASFSVLKDATATALYGVRGANGVILVTTRKGKEGKALVNAFVEYGGLAPTIMPKMADAGQFMKLYNDVYAESNNGQIYYSPEVMSNYLNKVDPDVYPNVNWMDEIYKDYTTSSRISLNVSGGYKMITYYVSGGYYKENGIYNAVEGDGYNPAMNWSKFNFRSNIDVNLHKNTVINLNLSNQFDVKNRPDITARDLFVYSFMTIPIASPTIFSDGTLVEPEKSPNPYNFLNQRGYVQLSNNNAQSLIGLTQDFSDLITPGLTANIKYSWDVVNSTELARVKYPTVYFVTFGDMNNARNPDGSLNLIPKNETSAVNYLTYWKQPRDAFRTTYLEASMTYDRLFNNKHRVGALFLYNMREQSNLNPDSYVKIFPYRYLGLAGRATYGFRDTYFFETNFGYNGSENFSPGNRFGFFPSVAAGYLISNESYFAPLLPVVDFLKIRASFGKAGNDNVGLERRFAYNSEMNQSAAGYPFGSTPVTSGGIATGYPGNPHVSWEESLKTDVGLEISFFNRLKWQVDYFHENRNGIFILQESVPSVVGMNVKPYVNSGKLENQGYDSSFEYTQKWGDVTFHARGNFTFNRNKVLANDKPSQKYQYRDEVGKPLYQQFGLVYLGLFESEEEIANSPTQLLGTAPRVGDAKYRDINNDGVVDEYDQIAIGRTHIPEIIYGFGATALWKGWDFSVLMQGVEHVTGLSAGSAVNGFETANLSTSNVFEDIAVNRWTEENPNPNAKYPRMSIYRNDNNNAFSTRNQLNLAFIRLKNIELGYTLPKSFTRTWGLSSVRLYLQGFNLYTFSPFKLWDPELRDPDDTYLRGNIYPNNKILNIGINLKF
jgi:TonB-linked SusC/RagA family outer membrane protein